MAAVVIIYYKLNTGLPLARKTSPSSSSPGRLPKGTKGAEVGVFGIKCFTVVLTSLCPGDSMLLVFCMLCSPTRQLSRQSQAPARALSMDSLGWMERKGKLRREGSGKH